MVLELPHSVRDFRSVTLAVELAGRLELELVGIFAEDEALAGLAQLPFLREFRISEGDWGRVDSGQMMKSATRTAARARELFLEVVKPLGIGAKFALAKGQNGDVMGSRSESNDIIVVIEPRNPVERVTYQFRQLVGRALATSASALFVPSEVRRRKGPVAVIAAHERDPSLQAALAVARSAGESLVLFAPRDLDRKALEIAARHAEVAVDLRPLSPRRLETAEVLSLLATTHESFLVMSRGMDGVMTSEIAFRCGVPVLVTAADSG